MYFLVFSFLVFIQESCSVENLKGWNYINLHCRDNENKPVDWWYIYKPPVDEIPFMRIGRNFTFITPDSGGRWQTSYKYITANSMLQNTLSPAYRPTYTDYLSVIAYESQTGNGTGTDDNPTRGVLMADQMGGFWMGHTVPGLLDFTKDRPSFPERETANGHLLTCLSLDLVTLNEVAVSIRHMSPRYTRIQMPMIMRPYLPAWNFLDGASWKGFQMYQKLSHRSSSGVDLDFSTRNHSLQATLMIRKPGDKKSLYEKFAQKKKLVLDIYGDKRQKKPLCLKDYGVRNIDSISLKTPDSVYYIERNKDRTGFAVSTGATWQRGGAGRGYWACAGALDLAMCVRDYGLWLSFDRFKVKEPEC